MNSSRLALLVLCAAPLAACSATAATNASQALDTRPFPRLAAQVADGPVLVEARYYLDHKRTFGAELPREARVLPVALKLGLAPGAAGSARIDPDQAGVRLYLPDGTVLASKFQAAVWTEFKSVNDLVAANALQSRVLPPWSAAGESFVYFVLGEAGEVFVRRGELTLGAGEDARSFALADALIAFELELDGQVRTLFVGLEVGNGAPRGN
jgi:hypothetical protein